MRFFFHKESPRMLALMRIGVGSVFFYDAAVRFPYAVELYSRDGRPMPLFPGTAYEPVAFSAEITTSLHALLVFSLLAVAIGWRTTWSLCLALALFLWFGLADIPGTFKKYSVIGAHLMLLLAVSQCGAVWSIDRLISGERKRLCQLAPVWPRRLAQILVCAIYWSAAVTKLRVADFASGDLLLFSLQSDLWGGREWGLWLSTLPTPLIWASVLTLLFELFFPVLIWVKALRIHVLSAAVLFHLSLAVLMVLGIFSPVMLIALCSFLTDDDLNRLASGFHRITRGISKRSSPEIVDGSLAIPALRRTVISSIGYVAIAVAAMTFGYAVQCQADWYGVFGNASESEFESVADETIDEIFAEQLPNYRDYFHRIEIGERLGNYHAFGEDEDFRAGSTIYVLARFVLDHPAWQLDWILIAPDGEQVAEKRRRVDATHSVSAIAFVMPHDAPTGRYRIDIRVDGYEVANLFFHLHPAASGNERSK